MIGQAQPRDGEPESASDEGQNGDNERRKKKKSSRREKKKKTSPLKTVTPRD
jgi:hypothetical protein